MFDEEKMGEILRVIATGYCEYVKGIWPIREEGITHLFVTKKFSRKEEKKHRKLWNRKMTHFHKLLFEFVDKLVLRRSERRHEANAIDMTYIDLLEREEKINFHMVMIIAREANMSNSKHSTPYRFILYEVIAHFGAHVSK